MPTDTFFRLPEEKRERIINAAWEEFTSVSFAKVSINRMIHAAEIPRGSFYQYFEDKNDLFAYLLGEVRQFALDGYCRVLEEAGGDVFQSVILSFDEVRRSYDTDAMLPVRRCFRFIQLNPGMDIQSMVPAEVESGLVDGVWSGADLGRLRHAGPRFRKALFYLLLMALGKAVVDSMVHPERAADNRACLLEQIEIIQTGCLRPAGTEKNEEEPS